MRRTLAIAAAIAAALAVVPLADARVPAPQPRQGACRSASGALPVITSVKVDGTVINEGDPMDAGSLPGAGKLYYVIDDHDGRGSVNGSDCLFDWTVTIQRDYSTASPASGQWGDIAGVGAYFLDHERFAKVINPAYADDPDQIVTAESTVEIKATMAASGDYAGANAYWYTSTGTLDGDRPITLAGNALTVTGHPAAYVHTSQQWPAALDPAFNPLLDTPPDYSSWPGGDPNGFGDSGPFGAGGATAQATARGLSFSFSTRFAETLGKGSEEQRGMWFETINTPRWSIMYGNDGGSPGLTFGMGNYHQYYSDTNALVLNQGSLRMMLPDAWGALGFGVTSASDPLLIQGAIQVIRQENGSSTPVVATTRSVSGVGIVLDVGEVHFSAPNFKTQRNKAVKATRQGNKKVKLTFSLTKAQAKTRITIWAGKSKLKKVKTLKKGKRGKNTVVVAYVKKGGYAVKAGSKLIGSAVLSN